MNETRETHPACPAPAGAMQPRVGVVFLNEDRAKKRVTKRHPDGRSLSMMFFQGKIVEKHMTCKMVWDLEAIKKEQDEGADGIGF